MFIGFCLFWKNYQLIAAYISNQKALDADSRVIQQIFFTGKLNRAAIICYILEQSEETTLQFCKGKTKVMLII